MASYTLLDLVNSYYRVENKTILATIEGTTDLLALHLIDQINYLMYEIAQAEDWDWLYSSSSITTVINQQEYSLASDCDTAYCFRQMNSPLLLRKRDRIWLSQKNPDYTDSTGDPQYYIPAGWQKVWLEPIPTAVMTINYMYKKFIVRMEDDDDPPDLPEPYQYILIQGIKAKGFEFSRHPDADKANQLYYAMLDKRVRDFGKEPPDYLPIMAGWDYGENPYR
jgi:hypothetical protein